MRSSTSRIIWQRTVSQIFDQTTHVEFLVRCSVHVWLKYDIILHSFWLDASRYRAMPFMQLVQARTFGCNAVSLSVCCLWGVDVGHVTEKTSRRYVATLFDQWTCYSQLFHEEKSNLKTFFVWCVSYIINAVTNTDLWAVGWMRSLSHSGKSKEAIRCAVIEGIPALHMFCEGSDMGWLPLVQKVLGPLLTTMGYTMLSYPRKDLWWNYVYPHWALLAQPIENYRTVCCLWSHMQEGVFEEQARPSLQKVLFCRNLSKLMLRNFSLLQRRTFSFFQACSLTIVPCVHRNGKDSIC